MLDRLAPAYLVDCECGADGLLAWSVAFAGPWEIGRPWDVSGKWSWILQLAGACGRDGIY